MKFEQIYQGDIDIKPDCYVHVYTNTFAYENDFANGVFRGQYGVQIDIARQINRIRDVFDIEVKEYVVSADGKHVNILKRGVAKMKTKKPKFMRIADEAMFFVGLNPHYDIHNKSQNEIVEFLRFRFDASHDTATKAYKEICRRAYQPKTVTAFKDFKVNFMAIYHDERSVYTKVIKTISDKQAVEIAKEMHVKSLVEHDEFNVTVTDDTILVTDDCNRFIALYTDFKAVLING